MYFDEQKFFGVDLAYVRGRREDLVKREDSWTLGFGAKFIVAFGAGPLAIWLIARGCGFSG